MRTFAFVALVAASCSAEPTQSADAGAGEDAGTPQDACVALVAPGSSFVASAGISEPANIAAVPVVAAREGEALIAWHEFAGGDTRIAYALVTDGCVHETRFVAETMTHPIQPSVAATGSGFALAWSANDGSKNVARAAQLGGSGEVVSGPETLSAEGRSASFVKIAASGDELAYAWTDGSAHYFARRGASETVPATPVGTTLQSTGLLNYPRIALDLQGTLFLVYRDGAPSQQDWEVLLTSRPRRGSFGAPVNVSRSPGLLSDDVSVVMNGDELDLVWVDQDPANNYQSFEVKYATRSAAGQLSTPAFFGKQGLWTWAPSVTRGLATVWYAGSGGTGGDLFFAAGPAAESRVLSPEQGLAPSIARGAAGELHLAFISAGATKQVRYAWMR